MQHHGCLRPAGTGVESSKVLTRLLISRPRLNHSRIAAQAGGTLIPCHGEASTGRELVPPKLEGKIRAADSSPYDKLRCSREPAAAFPATEPQPHMLLLMKHLRSNQHLCRTTVFISTLRDNTSLYLIFPETISNRVLLPAGEFCQNIQPSLPGGSYNFQYSLPLFWAE